jgi:hypothetical protein
MLGTEDRIHIQKTVKKHLLVLLVGFLVIGIIGGYSFGYRVGPGLTFVKVGILTLTGLPQGSNVYLDETSRTISNGGAVRLSLVPGNHSVIVDASGYYPWNDVFVIDTHVNNVLAPILIPTKISKERLKNEEALTAKTLEKNAILPTRESPIAMAKGCAQIFVESNEIIAEPITTSCTPPPYLCTGGSCSATIIFSPLSASIHSITKLPGREDVIVVGYGNTIAVVELNPLAPQFFAPLYVGAKPKAFLWDEKTIVVSDDSYFYRLAW